MNGCVEVKNKVNTYLIDLYCPKCSTKFNGVDSNHVLLSNPPKYLYKCVNCGYEEYIEGLYPKIEYEVIE